MDVRLIKRGVIAASFEREELEKRGIFAAEFNLSRAKELAREAMCKVGEDAAGEIAVDVYVKNGKLLLFAEETKKELYAAVFKTLEELLSYIPRHPKGAFSSLYLTGRAFCLVADSFAEGVTATPAPGEVFSAPRLIDSNAAEVLCDTFLK